jgi:hypothetical protein
VDEEDTLTRRRRRNRDAPIGVAGVERCYYSMVDIDIDKLPIPSWNLTCPKCDYVLNGLPAHRCPECGHVFEMGDVIPTWARLRDPTYTGDELPFPDFGLTCAGCRDALAGATTRACPSCRRPFDPRSFRPRREWFARRMGYETEWDHAAWTALEVHQIPYIRHDPARPYTMIGRSMVYVPSEFYFDFLHALGDAERRSRAAADMMHSREWRCPSCREPNPNTFEVCWNCGGERRRNSTAAV